MDHFKKHIDNQRDSFEIYSIDADKSWEKIESTLNRQDSKGIFLSWKSIAQVAAILFLISVVAVGYFLNTQRLGIDRNGIALHNISPDLADTEAFYASQIEEKIELISAIGNGLSPEVSEQMALLDQDYQSLKDDLKDNADSEEVINAMIQYYRLKLTLLEKILEEIQKDNERTDYEEVQAI